MKRLAFLALASSALIASGTMHRRNDGQGDNIDPATPGGEEQQGGAGPQPQAQAQPEAKAELTGFESSFGTGEKKAPKIQGEGEE